MNYNELHELKKKLETVSNMMLSLRRRVAADSDAAADILTMRGELARVRTELEIEMDRIRDNAETDNAQRT